MSVAIRIWRTEFLRGAAAPFAAGFGVAAVVGMLAVHSAWAGNWSALALNLRGTLVGGWPLLAATAAWTTRRDRRRRTTDLLASTPRPCWHPLLISWAALSAGATGALLLAWIACAAFVVPFATYSSGEWWWTLLVCVPVLGAASALGMLVGRVVRFNGVVPVLAIGGLLITAQVDAQPVGGHSFLLPTFSETNGYGDATFTGFAHLAQFAWFTALAITCFLLLALGRKRLVLLPGALAVTMLATILATPPSNAWQPDPVAAQHVCTTTGPEVCVLQYRAHLLDDYAALTQPMLTKLRGIPGAPARADIVPDNFRYSLAAHYPSTLFSQLRFADEARVAMAEHVVGYTLECVDTGNKAEMSRLPETVEAVAAGWLRGERSAHRTSIMVTDPDPVLKRLLALDIAAQRAWMGRYFAAVGGCDQAAMHALLLP